MKTNNWDKFAEEKLRKIFTDKDYIIDIGGGLRVDPKRNNRAKNSNPWLESAIRSKNYKILDKVPDYKPDIVGDIHKLPLADNSIEAIICLAVLEHVEEPALAVREMYRVLKPGGYCYIYVPFLYYYHPLKGYYQDFYRFTLDGVKYLTKDFSRVEIQNVRGALATVFNLFPIFSKRTGWFNWLDRVFKKEGSNQTSGFNIFCIK